MLDDQALDRFERTLRSAGAGIVEHWRPGLSDEQIEQLEARHELRLPEEARRLWRWHDGSRRPAPAGATEIAPGRLFTPLEVTLEEYSALVDAKREVYGLDRVIEPFTGFPHIYFDCRGAFDEPVPILVAHDIEQPVQTLPSIDALFSTWSSLVTDGLWSIQDDGDWDGSYIHRLTEAVLELGVY